MRNPCHGGRTVGVTGDSSGIGRRNALQVVGGEASVVSTSRRARLDDGRTDHRG